MGDAVGRGNAGSRGLRPACPETARRDTPIKIDEQDNKCGPIRKLSFVSSKRLQRARCYGETCWSFVLAHSMKFSPRI